MRNGPYTLVIAPEGYPGKHYRGRYAYEHIVVYWEHNGFVPEGGWEIHHIDGNHRNNAISNLLLVTKSEHIQLHRKPKTYISRRCSYCGVEYKIEKRQSHGKTKKYYCSRSHQHLSMTSAFRDSQASKAQSC